MPSRPSVRVRSSIIEQEVIPLTLDSWQKSCWDTYLSSGRGSDNLFRAIDSGHTMTLSVKELQFFAESVSRKGVHPRSFKMLDELARDHQITLKEFKSWLVLGT